MSSDITELSDEQLVERVRSQDKEMYRYIVERYQEPLLRYSFSMVRDGAGSADVTQSTFIKVYVNLNGFNTKRKFSSWLYRIAHNEAINYIKKHAKELHPDAEWFDSLVDSKTNLEELADKNASKQLLGKSIESLDIKYREPLLLHYFSGKSYEEISDVLRLPTSSVGTRIRRAKAQLKVVLEKEDHE